MTDDLSRTLLRVAQRAEVTGVGWRSLARFYDALPAEMNGLRVLDLCGGMSDCAYRLRQQGAQSFAVDLAYADIEAMFTRHRANFDATARDVFGFESGTERYEQLYAQFVGGFLAGLREDPSMYIAASATHLPFPDATFDVVVSFNGIFGTLDFDAAAVKAALYEAVRVTRPGGVIQLVPYQQGPVLNDDERASQLRAIAALSASGGVAVSDAVARSEALLGGVVGRLTIRKLAKTPG